MPVISPRSRRVLKWAGHVLSIAAIVFVLERLWSYHGQLDSKLIARLALPVGAMGLVYAGSCVLTALAWRDALRHLGVRIDVRRAIHVYGVSQVAKYLPGNVFHLLGRQARGVACGIPALPLAKSMAWELVLLCIAGALFLLLAAPRLLPDISRAGAGLLFLSALLVAGVWLRRTRGRWLGRGVLWNAGFLAVSGLIFAWLLRLVAPAAVPGADATLLLVSAYAIAWLAGFVTPGAPAGVGIREAVLYFLLQPLAAEPHILAAVIAGRCVSVIGDLVFFLYAQWAGGGEVMDPD